METQSMELDVWQGLWELPSVDPQCLTVMAYCKFSNVPINFHKANNPWRSPNGELPVLRHANGVVTKITDILNYLRKNNWGTDFDLTAKQSADLVAFSAMIDEKLVPALLHLWWVDSKTFTELTRPCYAKMLPFPFNYYYPAKKHKEYDNRIFYTRGSDNMSDAERESKIYKDAKECLNLLSTNLGDKEYFFGRMPSSIDAIVYGFLAPLLKAPLPNSMLQNHLRGCVNLCQLCQRISNKFFPMDAEEQEALRKQQEEEQKKQAESTEFPNRRRNMMVSGMVALTAMVGYAFLSGLVQVEISDKDNGNNDGGGQIPQPPNFTHFDRLFEGEGEGGGQEEKEQQEENQ